MPGRFRVRNKTRPGGDWYFNNNPTPPTNLSTTAGYSSCEDVWGDGDCHGFRVVDLQIDGGHLNKHESGSFASQFNDWVVDAIRSNATGDHIGGIPGIPSDVDAATQAAARTNPSRPYVDVPANVLDLGTAPKRILQDLTDMRSRDFWRAPPAPRSFREATSRVGERYLEYQFMIAPIVSDIVKMRNLSRVVNDRVGEINRLFGGQGLRRTVTVFNGSRSANISFVAQSAGILVGYNAIATESVTVRVHARWIPSGPCGLQPSNEQIRAWAVRSTLGLTVDASTLWEITPWSWLVDWFTGIGTYLKSQRNIVPAQLMGVYPMTHTKTEWHCPGYPITAWWDPNLVLGSLQTARIVKETKTRRSSFVSPFTVHLPFLSGQQMGVVASLAATRSR